MSETIPAAQSEQINEIQRRLAEGLARIDPYHRLLGRPVYYRVIDGSTFEITYRDVPGIAEAEVLGVHVDAVVLRQGKPRLELPRQVGLAVQRLFARSQGAGVRSQPRDFIPLTPDS